MLKSPIAFYDINIRHYVVHIQQNEETTGTGENDHGYQWTKTIQKILDILYQEEGSTSLIQNDHNWFWTDYEPIFNI